MSGSARELRERLERAFGVRSFNFYATTEGLRERLAARHQDVRPNPQPTRFLLLGQQGGGGRVGGEVVGLELIQALDELGDRRRDSPPLRVAAERRSR